MENIIKVSDKQNECIIVPYHYVHNPSDKFSKVYAKTIKDFKLQIDYLSKHYKIISLKDYILYLNKQKDIPEKTCILTFDDGLLDHYKNVYPILKKLNLPATFFVSGQPLLEVKILNVQMLQFLLAEVKIEKLIEEYKKTLKKQYPYKYKNYMPIEEKDEKLYIWYNPKVVGFKKAVRKMDTETQRNVLVPLFKKFIGDEITHCISLYMSSSQIKELSKSGFEIGSHSYSHPELTNTKELGFELVDSKILLETIINKEVESFSMPYGSYNEKIIKKIKKAGYKCCLNSEFKINKGKVNPFNLTRIDPMLIGENNEY